MSLDILVYIIDGQAYGLELSKIKSAVLAVEITPLPNSPAHILGAINVRGHITPVINTRHLFGWPSRELKTSDQFLLCHFNQKHMALWIDNIRDVKTYSQEELISAKQIFPDLKGLKHVLKEDDQFILLYDLEMLLNYYNN